ncbi:hypothetical protein L931_01105 [Helicobacter pylori PZ5024]|uniref:Uncharacterized protein n=1 Tax=Helicobacter pylori PZ5024 TaxID=1337391 RepID=T2SRH3_HELPX|nr:hypothetical protein L931_01105 [Helicobacter pylori PZ5024]
MAITLISPCVLMRFLKIFRYFSMPMVKKGGYEWFLR